MHGFIRQIQPNGRVQRIPYEMSHLCKTYCSSLIPALLKSIQSTPRNRLIQERMTQYFCDTLRMEYADAFCVAMRIVTRCTDDTELCDMFYDEMRILPRMAIKMRFEIELQRSPFMYVLSSRSAIDEKLRQRVVPMFRQYKRESKHWAGPFEQRVNFAAVMKRVRQSLTLNPKFVQSGVFKIEAWSDLLHDDAGTSQLQQEVQRAIESIQEQLLVREPRPPFAIDD